MARFTLLPLVENDNEENSRWQARDDLGLFITQ